MILKNYYMKDAMLIIILIFVSSCSWLHPKYSSDQEGRLLPDINLILEDNKSGFNTSSITSGKPFIIFLYHPYCPYCRAQTAEILKNIGSLQDIRLYMISADPDSLINQYSNLYRLNKYSNIILARDSTDLFGDYFKVPGVPYLAFYDKQKKLKQVLLGKYDFKAIKDILIN
jgi:thiol-disulfide isomerase/thioredoxin